MTRIGYFLSSEEHTPRALVRQAQGAEAAGFDALWISDHFHPWLESQGQSPFVWTVAGAVGQATALPITTAVTCPTTRMHPAVIAHATATTAALARGGFTLGVGTGEALNEHILGLPWPPAAQRIAMLEEAIEVMRRLWTGKLVTHRGEYYDLDTARIYTLPEERPRVYMSAFGPKATTLAASVADGLIQVAPSPDTIEMFRARGGAGKPVQGGLKVCWHQDEAEARRMVHHRWPTEALPGEALQLLPLPRHFGQLTGELVSEDMVAAKVPCGPDPDVHMAAIRPYLEAGVDELFISQVGDDQEGFFEFFTTELLPRLRAER
ncbi:TIGR03557 family F420-dependent LLM class oxidoreductase [Nocardiopsis sp. HNM0947]|uniref:TIGR03557 family F420-dependent LLM class oxidoreductase n=1 Tax=Nocardiopsis coralli TaxID=2772213 RepID=A0ABR9PE51_9ACTN|nr:TIGR03557 family F420-dependent LLM class oxidoreductase [Nocardiopsis coralli]MBE3002128.1 TIGR03557 family F420-dependent LLM class oxidoreductase [Nocardiopsis coralli]